VVIEHVARQRAERNEREEADRRAHDEAVEEARRAFEAERLRLARR
jgi:hypothetical protein